MELHVLEPAEDCEASWSVPDFRLCSSGCRFVFVADVSECVASRIVGDYSGRSSMTSARFSLWLRR